MADIILYEGNNELNVGLIPIPLPVANLYGVVTDANTGSPLPGVTVTLNGMVAVTNASGEYLFEGLEPGKYVVEFSKEGYETVTR